jgi:hypothetical protein
MRALGDILELLAMTGGAGPSNDYKEKDGTLIFRVRAFVGAVGLIGVLVMLAMFILAIADSSQFGAKLFLGSMFGLLGLPLFLSYIVSGVYIDAESITLRNPLGIKKSMLWGDLKAVYTASPQGDIKVCGEKNEILIFSYFKGEYLIEALIDKFCPEAFKIESLLGSSVIPKSYRKKNGALVFRTNKIIAGVSVLFLLFDLFLAFYPLEKFEPMEDSRLAAKLAVIAFFAIPALILMLYSFIRRVYIDSKKIEYRNILGLKKEIYWKDAIDCDTFMNSWNEYFKVSSRDKAIKIAKGFSGYGLITDIIYKYCPKRRSRKKSPSRKKHTRK